MIAPSLKSFLIKIVALYILLGGGYYFLQRFVFFHPQSLPAQYVFSFNQKFQEKQIQLDEHTLVDIVQFKVHDSVAKGVVLYLHGNQQNIERYAEYAPNFTKHGYECWMVDYPGYGKSTGVITQESMQQCALQLYKMARAKFAKEKIVIYGKSIGTGPAAWLASVSDCRQLILETPYYSIASLANRYLPFLPIQLLTRVNFSIADYCKDITVPITIFHGLQDEVIPFTNAMQLIPSLKKGDSFIPISKGLHNNLPNNALYQSTLTNLLAPQ